MNPVALQVRKDQPLALTSWGAFGAGWLWIEAAEALGPHIFFDLTDLPADFGNADSASITVRTRGDNLTSFSDDFNRADELLAASPDWDDAIFLGDDSVFSIVSNQAQAATFSVLSWAVATHDMPLDMVAQAHLIGSGTQQGGVMVRADDVAKDAYLGMWSGAFDEWRILRILNDVFTVIASKAAPTSVDVLIQLQIVGNDLDLIVDGVTELSVTDTDIPNRTGVGIFHSASGTLDDFQASGLPLKLFARIFQSDETTPLSDEIECVAQYIDGTFTNHMVAFTGLNTTADKTVWDAARIRFRWGT